MAAVLACGPEAVLSHRSAAALWGISAEVPGWTEVSIPASSLRRSARIRVYRSSSLRPSDLTVRDRIPVTGIVRTMLDIATQLDRVRLERAINEADRLDLIDPEALFEALESYTARPGVGKLREILGRHSFRLTDSELERRFLPLVAAAGLPVPVTGKRLNPHRPFGVPWEVLSSH